MRHRGPVCKECKKGFYYDYLDKPEPHEGTGLCWECWIYHKVEGTVFHAEERQEGS